MTRSILPRFPRRAALALAVPAAALGMLGATAASASASTTAPTYGHQRCGESLSYVQEDYYGGQYVFVRDVCPGVEIFHTGGYGRHRTEDVFYQTERHGYLRDHFATDVRDAEVYF